MNSKIKKAFLFLLNYLLSKTQKTLNEKYNEQKQIRFYIKDIQPEYELLYIIPIEF
jgi:hypothetical protein